MSHRILVVEDDDLQQQVLKSALEKRGYETAVASDGLTAVRMLRGGGFDLALIDYYLPEMDGLASARLLHDLMSEERPKLIAVTAALDSLGGRDMQASAFDAMVAKPLDLPALMNVVAGQLHETAADRTSRAALDTWRELGMADAPAVAVLPCPTPSQAQLLRHYFDLSGRREAEAVLLLTPTAGDEAVEARTRSSHFTLPFIDLTGCIAGADAIFSAADRQSWGKVASAIRHFAERRRALARTIGEATDLETRLLAYMFVSGHAFEPTLDATSRDCVRYAGFFPDGDARLAAERLATGGLLERRFVERFHACGSCGSARLNVREECMSCGSAHLREVPIVHHFRCAHQAPEADFIQGPNLVCPKCRQHLRHYGSDYDKPGTVMSCVDCGIFSPEPAIGFVCLDCGAHTDGDAAPKRDMFSYRLTAAGIALLRRGTARLAATADQPIMSLPASIREELARPGPAAMLVTLHYGARQRILARRGPRGFEAMRRLFMENLVSAIEGQCTVATEAEADYLLIRPATAVTLDELSPALLDACQEVLSEGLEPELRVLEQPVRERPLAAATAR